MIAAQAWRPREGHMSNGPRRRGHGANLLVWGAVKYPRTCADEKGGNAMAARPIYQPARPEGNRSGPERRWEAI